MNESPKKRVTTRKTITVETVGEAYLDLLAARGIEFIFGNGGTDFAPIVEGLAAIAAKGSEPRVKLVSVPHENVAVSMAHGYYLQTGRPQAVMFHVNVGTANGINALTNAARDRIPILFTAGRSPWTEGGQRGSRDTGIHWAQEMFDQGGMVRELCKWDYELRTGANLEDVVDRALEIATSEPCGPVYLSLPREVLSAPLDTFTFDTAPRRAFGTVAGPNPAAIEAAADLIARAERPLIFAREVARVAENSKALADFAERFGLPVIEYRPVGNSLPSDHPLYLDAVPIPHVREADLILNIDTDVPWIPDPHGGPPDDCRLIQMGVDPLFQRLPMRSFKSDVVVTGPARVSLPLLAKALEGRVATPTITARREKVAEFRAGIADEVAAALPKLATQAPIHPAWVSHCLAEAKDADTIVCNEYPIIPRFVPFRRPRTYFGIPSAGGLGWALGAAIGVKLAAPERTVVATIGDGTYMFGNPTAAHQILRTLDLPMLFVVFNNAMWEEVERAALSIFPDGHAARSNQVPVAQLGPHADLQHVMAAYGGFGERVDTPEDLPGAFERAMHAVKVDKRQALLNVIVGRRDAGDAKR